MKRDLKNLNMNESFMSSSLLKDDGFPTTIKFEYEAEMENVK